MKGHLIKRPHNHFARAMVRNLKLSLFQLVKISCPELIESPLQRTLHIDVCFYYQQQLFCSIRLPSDQMTSMNAQPFFICELEQ